MEKSRWREETRQIGLIFYEDQVTEDRKNRMEKERLDLALVNRGLVNSREKGKALIMAGKVYVNQQKSDKPGTLVKASDLLTVKGEGLPYVSRGGLKLEKALRGLPWICAAK